MAELTLPKEFFFGAAMSGPQTEGGWNVGGKLENLWDTWSNEDIGAFHNRVGSYVGNDFMHRYQEDLAILKGLGLDSFRTSIQWSRLLDADGNVNPEGAAWYHELFRAAREAGLEPFVTLYHFDLPTYLFRRGGWESRETCEAYANYVEKALHEFGKEVRYWFTFNEPSVEPENRYWHGGWYPQHHSFREAVVAQYNISIAHALGVARYRAAREEGALRPDARIGIVCNFSPSYTKEDPSEADLEALRMNDGLTTRWWLDLATMGSLPADVLETLARLGTPVPARPGDEEVLRLGVVDWLGCNYYQPCRVQAPSRDRDEWGNPLFAEPYVWPERV
ncbi:glycoside hydrolase family 1 protein, partial [Enorma massiliensis]|uniref:glycoside hydrolase family 1 protein n=1 Tax=Enorma massiliensis TaxID=1472761 RepID=UPI0019580716